MQRMAKRSITAAAGIAVAVAAQVLFSESWVFPPNAGITNVVQNGVDNTGKTDVTAKLNSILSACGLSCRKMIYLPNGTYLVSGTIQCPTCNGAGSSDGPLIVGESRKGTVIRLKDGTWPVDTLAINRTPGYITRQVVFHGGDCGNNTYAKVFRNFTIDIGSNNDGAIGMNHSSSNYGVVSDIDVISRDGKGCIGIALTGGEIGPEIVQHVYVKGFKTGIYASAADDATISQAVLEDQSKYGVFNAWTLSIDSLIFSTSAANVPAVLNLTNGRLVMINSILSGNSTNAAIISASRAFLRNIQTAGYQRPYSGYVPTPAPTTSYIAEYSTNAPVGTWYTPGHSLNLPVKYHPYSAWEQDLSKWNDIKRYIDGGQTQEAAIKSAFGTTGKTSVFVNFNSSGYTTKDTVYIEGDISRVVGGAGKLFCPAVVIRNNNPPVITLQDWEINPWNANPPTLIIRSSKTVIINELFWGFVIADGTGDVFINQMEGRLVVKNPNQRVWLRSYNAENAHNDPGDTSLILVTAGKGWLMGYKTEGANVKAECSGGFLEMFDILNYNIAPSATRPVFRVSGTGQFSVAMLTQITHTGTSWPLIVRETRNGQVKELTNTNNPQGYNVDLYTGFNQADKIAASPAGSAVVRSMSAIDAPGKRLVVTITNDLSSAAKIEMIDSRGCVWRPQCSSKTVKDGASRNEIDISQIPAGIYCLRAKVGPRIYLRDVVRVQ